MVIQSEGVQHLCLFCSFCRKTLFGHSRFNGFHHILNRLQLCFFLIGHFLDHDLLKPVGVDIDIAVKKSDNGNHRHYDNDNNSEYNAQHRLA